LDPSNITLYICILKTLVIEKKMKMLQNGEILILYLRFVESLDILP